jgi:uncharacterized protein involved in response to NO
MSNTASIPIALQRRRDYAGPALFSYGFRPFFLAAAAWAALALALWVAQYLGALTLPIAIGPLDWHVHEMLYGYVAAAVAGFLLTAIPNWTGRLPVMGPGLAALAALWLAGRVAMAASAKIGLAATAVIDVLFLVALAAVALREIVAGRNWRNLRVLVIIGVLIAGNVVFHLEWIRSGAADYGIRIGIAAVIALITLVGGRIIPSFTRNWLARQAPGRLPAPFARFDGVAIAAGALALAAWVAAPASTAAGVLLLAAGVLHAVRLARWAGERTFADRLVLVLHVGYLFVPVGFVLVGAAALWPDHAPVSAGVHAWTAGATGIMTLAVMTRASLGHTGQPLAASPATQAIYLCALVAALTRIVAACTASTLLMEISALAWLAAFGGFVVAYGPLLARRKPVWMENKC